jgi:hypothetical protein
VPSYGSMEIKKGETPQASSAARGGRNRVSLWASLTGLESSVAPSMTDGAERDQILRHIPAELAPALDVMNLQVFHDAAVLAPPAISFQDLVPEHAVVCQLQSESWLLLVRAHRIRYSPTPNATDYCLPIWRLRENLRRSFPGSNRETCRFQASGRQFQKPSRSRATGSCRP